MLIISRIKMVGVNLIIMVNCLGNHRIVIEICSFNKSINSLKNRGDRLYKIYLLKIIIINIKENVLLFLILHLPALIKKISVFSIKGKKIFMVRKVIIIELDLSLLINLIVNLKNCHLKESRS